MTEAGDMPIKSIAGDAMMVVQKLDGAASLLALLEEKADDEGVSSSEIMSIRCIIECCSKELDALFIKC